MQLDPKVNILLVDDRVENLLSLEAVLSSLGENLVKAHPGRSVEAIARPGFCGHLVRRTDAGHEWV